MAMERIKNGIPTRYVVATVCFLNLTYVQMIHLNSIHILMVMINTTSPIYNKSEIVLDEEVLSKDYLRFVIPASYVAGYTLTQFPGGRLAEWIGTKYLFAAMQTTSGLMTVSLPALAQAGVEFFIMGTVTLGMTQGTMIPSVQPLILKWSPIEERTCIATLIHSGLLMGMILSISTKDLLTDALGWKGALTVEGFLMVLVVTGWLACIYNSPRLHPRISHEEKLYIETSAASLERQRLGVPWKAIFKSLSCWALFITSLAYNWGFYILFAQVPVYLRTVLYQGNDSENKLIFLLPWLLMWLSSIIIAILCDTFVQRRHSTVAKVRKVSNTIGFVGPAIALTLFATIECDWWWSLILSSLASGLLGAVYSGVLVNHLDLTGNFAGTMFGLVQGVSTIVIWMAALIIGERAHTFVRWQVAFLISAGILVASSAIFLFFGSTERQAWDMIRTKSRQPSVTDRLSQNVQQPLLIHSD